MSAEFWDNRYNQENHLYGYQPNKFLVEQARFLRRNSRVLCLGDGEGRNGVWLAEQGHQVTTVDFSEVGVAKAKAWAAERGVSIDAQVADLEQWIFSPAADGPWDGLVMIFCHFPAELRAKIARVLTLKMAPQSWLLMESFTPGQLSLTSGGPKDEARLLTRDRVIKDWPGWHLEIKITERRLTEGVMHQGLASVIQVLGRSPEN